MANMDALSIPAGGGVDTTALIVDYSNGNDGIILKDKTTLADIKGQQVNLVELSVATISWPARLTALGCLSGTSPWSTHPMRT